MDRLSQSGFDAIDDGPDYPLVPLVVVLFYSHYPLSSVALVMPKQSTLAAGQGIAAPYFPYTGVPRSPTCRTAYM